MGAGKTFIMPHVSAIHNVKKQYIAFLQNRAQLFHHAHFKLTFTPPNVLLANTLASQFWSLLST